MIKVSVIVPVYKVPLEYLQACLDSLMVQTMQECEFILVSDGAPEGEVSVCKKYTVEDSRFRFFNREHAGVSAARNYGIRMAQGEYISFVDADDWIERNALELLYQYATTWNSDIISTNYIMYRNNASHTILWSNLPKEKLDGNDVNRVLNEFISLKDNSIPRGVCAKLYKKSFVDKIQVHFDENIKIQEDTLFNQICFSKATNISYLNTLLYHYRENLQSTTRRYRKNYLEEHIQAMMEIEKISNYQQKPLIGKEFARHFYLSWDYCYMNPKNTDNFFTRMRDLSKVVCSNNFQFLISDIDSRSMSIPIRFELFLFKKKIFFPIWLHGLKKLFV